MRRHFVRKASQISDRVQRDSRQAPPSHFTVPPAHISESMSSLPALALVGGATLLTCAVCVAREALTTGAADSAEPLSGMTPAQLKLAVDCLREVPGWAGIKESQLKQTVVQGGLTNLLFRLSYMGDSGWVSPTRTVLVRIYGAGTDGFFSRDEEIAAFQALSSVGASPKCYGTFEGGRLEEFLEGSTLGKDDIKVAETSVQVAAAMAAFHASNPPIAGPRDNALMKVAEQWIDGAKKQLASDLSATDKAIVASSSFDFSAGGVFSHFLILGVHFPLSSRQVHVFKLESQHFSFGIISGPRKLL